MWIYLLFGSDGLPPIVLYDYQPGRGGKYARSFLEGFTGLLQCDGYQGYNKVEGVILVCCLVHCQRKFYEAVPAGRRKKLKLQDIRSDGPVQEPVIPEEAELPELIALKKLMKEEKNTLVFWRDFENGLVSLISIGYNADI